MIKVNGVVQDSNGETVSALLKRMAVNPRGIAVALNGDVVHRATWEEVIIEDGAVVEIVTAAAGG